MKMRFWLRPLLALAAAGVCLFLLGRLTRPKYTEGILEGGLIDDYYEETGGHQVLFIGDCEVYESFTPPTLFAEYGYTSFIRGTAQQLMWQSRYILEETLAYETPRAVVLSVCSLRYGESQSEGYNRMTLDYMRPSLYKWKAVVASLGEGESPVTYALPLLRYHTRISALTAEDWKYLFKTPVLSHNGYLMRCDTVPYTRLPAAPPLEDYAFSSRSYGELDEIVSLCREKGIELILVKSPCLYPAWYSQWDEALEAYAREKGVVYVNGIQYMEEMGIDLSTDTYDGGIHLNVYGAEKYTRWFAQTFLTPLRLEDERQVPDTAALYAEKLAAYEKEKQAQLEEIAAFGYLKSRKADTEE